MQVFVHYKVRQLEDFLSELSRLNNLFNEKSLQFNKELEAYFDQLIDGLKKIGNSTSQATVEDLRNYFQLATEGIDPDRLEKIKTGRRSLTRRSAYYCLSRMNAVLQEDLEKEQTILRTAEDQIGKLVLSFVQAGAITSEELAQELNQDQLETIWHRLSQNEQMKLHERNLKLSITQEDIFVLFASVLNRI